MPSTHTLFGCKNLENEVQLQQPLLTPDEFKAAYKARGWNGRMLAIRWNMTASGVSRLVNDLDRSPHWDEAVRSLPEFQQQQPLLTSAEFKSLYKSRGWNGRMLANRWDKTAITLSRLVNDLDRKPHWDDAVRGLPEVQLQQPLLAPDEFKFVYKTLGWNGRKLASRWKKTSVWISKIASDPDRDPHWDDAVRGLPKLVVRKTTKAK